MSTVPTRHPKQYASIFVFRSKNFVFHISISGGCTGKREVSKVQKRCPEKYATIFIFWSKNFSISISGGRTGERDMSLVPTRCPEKYSTIFVFWCKKVSSISRFLKVAKGKGQCQCYQRGVLYSMRPFLFKGPKNFSWIS